MSLMSDVVCFESSTRAGDAYMMEILHVRWLPLMKAAGKIKYTECAIKFIETAYGALSVAQLHEQRCNRTARFREGEPAPRLPNSKIQLFMHDMFWQLRLQTAAWLLEMM
jgi:hypothetical protein